MNYSHMTFAEIRRITEPQTELEKVLLEKYEDDLEDEIMEAIQQLKDVEDEEREKRIGYLEGLLLANNIKFDGRKG
jgi:hypothetical protein